MRQPTWRPSSILYHELSFCFAFLRRERTQTVHLSGSSEPDTSSIRSRCILRTILRINEWTRARDRQKKGLRIHISTWEWLRQWIYVFLKAFLNYSSTARVGIERERNWEEKDKCEGEKECWRWREKWQLIGIWVSSSKSSVIQQHLHLLALKLLWDLKAPGLSCSPGTASDPCLAYTANRNAYLHQPGQLKSLPLCPRSVSVERRL